jgi:predicted transcriptional regulator
VKRKKHRSQAGIIYDVLRTIRELGETPPTRIMYGANLPYDRTKEIVSKLVKKGLIKEVEYDGRKYYVLTEEGVKALNELEKTKNLLEKLGLRF